MTITVEQVKEARKLLGWSQFRLAVLSTVNAGDGEQLTAKALVALASAKGLTGEWMIKRDQDKAS